MVYFYYNVNLKITKNKHESLKMVLIYVESVEKAVALYVDSR